MSDILITRIVFTIIMVVWLFLELKKPIFFEFFKKKLVLIVFIFSIVVGLYYTWTKPVSFRAWVEYFIEKERITYEKTYRQLSKGQMNKLISILQAGSLSGKAYIYYDNSERQIHDFANQISDAFMEAGWSNGSSGGDMSWANGLCPTLIVRSTEAAKVAEQAMKAVNMPVLKIVHNEKEISIKISNLSTQADVVFILGRDN